jgi:hypothetical protein
VPPVDAALGHAPIQHREPLLARALADDLAKVYFSSLSARLALSETSAKAISGSIIQNSARWRPVFEFSARNVGPKV